MSVPLALKRGRRVKSAVPATSTKTSSHIQKVGASQKCSQWMEAARAAGAVKPHTSASPSGLCSGL